MTIRVVVVDDQEIVRAGFAALLGTQADFAWSALPPTATRRFELCRDGAAACGADGRAHAGHGRHRGDAPGDGGRQAAVDE